MASYAYIAVDMNNGKAYLVFEEIRTKQELWDVIQRNGRTHQLSANPKERENKIAIEVAPTTHPRGLHNIIFEYLGGLARREEVILRNPVTGYQELQKAFP